jgi:hypothetical protein
MKRHLLLCLAAAALAGCAWQKPTLRTEERSTNGTVRIQETRITSWALWPATQEIARQKASNGKTQSIGQEALSQDGGSTNVASTLRELRLLVETATKATP